MEKLFCFFLFLVKLICLQFWTVNSARDSDGIFLLCAPIYGFKDIFISRLIFSQILGNLQLLFRNCFSLIPPSPFFSEISDANTQNFLCPTFLLRRFISFSILFSMLQITCFYWLFSCQLILSCPYVFNWHFEICLSFIVSYKFDFLIFISSMTWWISSFSYIGPTFSFDEQSFSTNSVSIPFIVLFSLPLYFHIFYHGTYFLIEYQS